MTLSEQIITERRHLRVVAFVSCFSLIAAGAVAETVRDWRARVIAKEERDAEELRAQERIKRTEETRRTVQESHERQEAMLRELLSRTR